ncbi:MAG: hypothetical protein FWG44_02210 [Oscillospiraceae bacterium]|nr:hypothetical protein [Oscillospiraceae bacterium]
MLSSPDVPKTKGDDSYNKLKKKYHDFGFPQTHVEVNGKPVSGKKKETFIGEITVDLTAGFEASVVNFRIFGAYDQSTGDFNFSDVEKQALLGVSLKVYVGYLGVLEPVFVGFVASVSFGYDGIDPPYIEITGMDAKGVMMASSYAYSLKVKSYGEAVNEILKRTAYTKMQSAKIIEKISVSDTPDKKQGGGGNDKASAETIEMVSESDYDFIIKAAKKFNFDFFIDRGNVIFRKAKSAQTPLMCLAVGKGVITFNLEYSLTGMVQKIEVRSLDAGKGQLIKADGTYSKDMSTGSAAKALINKSQKVYIDPSIHSEEQAKIRLDSLMEEMSYKLGYLECECIGIPEILPGNFIEIEVGSPADNKFYITNVTHRIKNDGTYTTKIIGKIDSVKKKSPI